MTDSELRLPPSIEALLTDEWSKLWTTDPRFRAHIQRIAAEACLLQREADLAASVPGHWTRKMVEAAPLVVEPPK